MVRLEIDISLDPEGDFLNDLNINNMDGITLRRDPQGKFSTPNPISSKSKQQFTPMVIKQNPNDIGYATAAKNQDRN